MKVVVSSLILCGLIAVVGTASSAEVSPKGFTSKEPVESQAQSPMDIIQDPIYTAPEVDSNLGHSKTDVNENSDYDNEPQVFVSC